MFNNNVLIRLLGKCYYSKSIVNIDLWIEKYSNWIVVAVFLLFSTSVLLRMAALFFHDQWKPVHKDSEWSPSQTLSMHHTLQPLISHELTLHREGRWEMFMASHAAPEHSITFPQNSHAGAPSDPADHPPDSQISKWQLTERISTDCGLGSTFTNDIIERKQRSGFSHYHCSWNSRATQEDKYSKLCSNIHFRA